MDFTNRNSQPAADNGPTVNQQPAPVRRSHSSSASKKDMWSRIGVVSALVAVVILIVGLIVLVYSNNNNSTAQNKYIYNNKLQAVFLNTGQVYFGNIRTINDKFLVLGNIYYLQTTSNGSSSSSSSSSSSASNVTLVKLGCELHMPYDQMVINMSQVTFWENLQENGQVAKAVSTFQQQNPNGQKCADQSSSSGNTSSSVQSAGSH